MILLTMNVAKCMYDLTIVNHSLILAHTSSPFQISGFAHLWCETISDGNGKT